MNISELEEHFEISFHDSLLHALRTDFVAQTADFELNVCVGDPDAKSEKERERRRMARLRLTGLQYLAVDSPDPSYPYRDSGPVDVDHCEADVELADRYSSSENVFSGRFFVSDWNAFIHYSAKHAELSWLGPG